MGVEHGYVHVPMMMTCAGDTLAQHHLSCVSIIFSGVSHVSSAGVEGSITIAVTTSSHADTALMYK